MSTIIQNNRTYSIAEITNRHETLPQGVYMIHWSDTKGFYLMKEEDFKLPSRIYGDHSITQRWLRSFNTNSEKNMGILLSGIRGSGKTITAQQFCVESGLPVLLLTHPFHGTEFTSFITDPALGKYILFMDEFEKVYNVSKDNTAQDGMLSLMDGMFATNIIFLLTVNKDNLSENLVNRLGRIKYRKHYVSLEDDVVAEVIDDMLINKEHVDSIYHFFNKIGMCTYDILVNIIKEMNLFGEDALECGKHLNLVATQRTYTIVEVFNGKEYQLGRVNTNLFSPEYLHVDRTEVDDEDEKYWGDDGSSHVWLEKADCELVREGKVVTVKDNRQGITVKCTEVDYSSLLF